MSASAWVLCEYRFIASADVSALEGAGGAPHVVVETRDERTTRARAPGNRIQAIALPEEEGTLYERRGRADVERVREPVRPGEPTLRGERLRVEDGVVTDLHGADSPLRVGLLRGPTAGQRKQDCCQERDHSRHSSAGSAHTLGRTKAVQTRKSRAFGETVEWRACRLGRRRQALTPRLWGHQRRPIRGEGQCLRLRDG